MSEAGRPSFCQTTSMHYKIFEFIHCGSSSTYMNGSVGLLRVLITDGWARSGGDGSKNFLPVGIEFPPH